MFKQRIFAAFAVAAAACGPGPTSTSPPPPPPAPSLPTPPPAWSPTFDAALTLDGACRPEAGAALPWVPEDWGGLAVGDALLSQTTLGREGWLPRDGRPGLFDRLREDPEHITCRVDAVADRLRAALEAPTPVADLLRVGAAALGSSAWHRDDPDDPLRSVRDFETAQQRLCEAAGGCAIAEGELPEALQDTLTPVLLALADVLRAQADRFEGDVRGQPWWARHGGDLVLVGSNPPNPGYRADRDRLVDDRRRLYAATERLAHTLESARWPAEVAEFSLATGAGWLIVAGVGDDVHEEAQVLLRIDLGGDDVYLADQTAPVHVDVDLGGDDVRTYRGAETATAAGHLPEDAAGRGSVADRLEQGTLSTAARQGAARAGVSLVFDLGAGRDHYVTLRGGQGYAHEGVGVLFDAGGDDVYLAEAGAQGAAQAGIGLLIDLGAGADRYAALHAAQGFGGPAGFGALVDDGGDDDYRCAAAPARYPAPQRPGVNASFCQGAGLGFRPVAPTESLAGGLGVLFDASGHDRYDAAVYGQGVGYWMGTGLLIDGAGRDVRVHDWYAGGAGVHVGLGVLRDQGPESDVYGDAARSTHMTLGAAHHFGFGALLEAGGDEEYLAPTLSAGAASCGSLGLFVDAKGDDIYRAPHGSALGVASCGTCEEAGAHPSRGLFVDGGGADTYPASVAPAEDGARWGACLDGDPSEQAAAADL